MKEAVGMEVPGFGKGTRFLIKSEVTGVYRVLKTMGLGRTLKEGKENLEKETEPRSKL